MSDDELVAHVARVDRESAMTRLEQSYAVAVLSAFTAPGTEGLSAREGEVEGHRGPPAR